MRNTFEIFTTETTLLLLLFGALGALAKDVILDNKLVLPKICNGEISLGFLGGVISGALVGYLVDNNITTAFFSGYAGTAIFEQLLTRKSQNTTENQDDITAIISSVCRTEGVDPDLALRVARCESNLHRTALNTNTDGSRDRGIFQWNDKWHPEITDDMAYDPMLATKLFCKAYKAGNISWWNASKTCWNR